MAVPQDAPPRGRVLMLVATSVATDTRVLREAGALVADGWSVHIIGKDVPEGFEPPAGLTVSSAGGSSLFRASGAPSASARRLSPPARLARWALLPQHRNAAFGSWAEAAAADAAARDVDVVHAHDFTALPAAAALAARRGVPYVYDSHELWSGRARQYRPTPLQDRRERREEAALGRGAAFVITVGDGVAGALRDRFGWDHVVVVRNSFPAPTEAEQAAWPPLPETPTGLVYAGRVDAHRELETALEARPALPLTFVGPADDAWVARHQGAITAAGATLRPAEPVAEVTLRLRRAGVALVTHSDRFESHRLALPNKLFHAVLAGVPVVATDVPELAAVVRAHSLGELYRPGDPAALAAAVNRVTSGYAERLAAVVAARGDLSWDADAARLRSAYRSLALG